jgi:5-carboxymethyl-2-hydroxymuconate isomerase
VQHQIAVSLMRLWVSAECRHSLEMTLQVGLIVLSAFNSALLALCLFVLSDLRDRVVRLENLELSRIKEQ